VARLGELENYRKFGATESCPVSNSSDKIKSPYAISVIEIFPELELVLMNAIICEGDTEKYSGSVLAAMRMLPLCAVAVTAAPSPIVTYPLMSLATRICQVSMAKMVEPTDAEPV
jgi:hypothetical protein